jgi:hypothetical protein
MGDGTVTKDIHQAPGLAFSLLTKGRPKGYESNQIGSKTFSDR